MLAYWFPAFDPDLGHYSPGVTLCLRMAEAAAADGIDQVDLGKGTARYKTSLSNREIGVAEGVVAVSRPVAVARRAQSAVMATIRDGRLGARLRAGHVGAALRTARSTARRLTGVR